MGNISTLSIECYITAKRGKYKEKERDEVIYIIERDLLHSKIIQCLFLHTGSPHKKKMEKQERKKMYLYLYIYTQGQKENIRNNVIGDYVPLPQHLPMVLVHHLTTQSSQKRTANHHNGGTGQLNRAVCDGTRGADHPYTRERKGSWEGVG